MRLCNVNTNYDPIILVVPVNTVAFLSHILRLALVILDPLLERDSFL
jgi:hypothetical protein